jgi:hypothetical protein
LSCPKFLVGHPEPIENNGFRLKDCRNDEQLSRLYKQTLIHIYGEVAEPVEGSRLLSGCGGKTSPRVRIPASPPDTHKVIRMKTLIIKSLLTSLCQREGINPSLVKRGKGRFYNNDAFLVHSSVTAVNL